MNEQFPERSYSEDDFANLGAPQVVYIRPVKLSDGSKTFSIYAANGLTLAEDLPSFEEAVAAARDNEYQPVSVH